MYFYKDTVNNLFHLGDDILPAGRYKLTVHNNGTVVIVESADSSKFNSNPIEVVLLQREDDSYYPDLAALLVENKDFFKGGYAGDVTSLEGRVTAIEDTQLKILYYEEIDGTTTSGQISIPTGAEILFDQWEGGVDAVLSNIPVDKPDYQDTGVDVTALDSSGNYTLSGTLFTDPAAFIYWILVPIANLGTLDTDFVIDQSITFPAGSIVHHVINVAESGGDFTSVKAAIDSITDNSVTNRYAVMVAPGIYTEDNPIQGKSYVNVEAISMHTVRIVAGNPNEDLFIGENLFYIIGFSLLGVTGANNYAVNHSVLGECLVKDCVITDCSNGILVNGVNAFMNILTIALYTPNDNLGIGINVLAGNVTLSFLKVVTGSTIATVLNIDGTNSTVLVDTFTAASPNITTGISIDNDGSLSGFGLKIAGAYDGLIVQGTGTSVKLDAMQILACQNDGARLNNVGTDVTVGMFATTISGCTRYNFNIENPNCTVTGSGFSELAKGYIAPGAKFYAYILDISEDDEGLNVLGELHVGSVGNPAESVFGEGDSSVLGMKVFTFDGVTTWVDVSAAAASASGSTFTFPGLTADNSIYIASQLQQAGDYYKHSGIKHLVSTAAVMGVGGEIVAEYWDGGAWVEINGMTTEGSGQYHSKAKAYFQETGSFHLRLDTELSRAAAGWTVTNPMGYSVALYWIRYRITSLITTAPIFEQWKYHTNRFETNVDGYIEYFGNARPIGQLPINIGTSAPIAGNMQSEDIWIDENIGVGYRTNKFTTTSDILGLSTRVPFNMDTSSNIYFIWSGLFSQAHTPVFTFRWYWVEQGASLYTSNPTASGNSKSITISRAVLADINETFIAILDVSDLIPKRPINYGDELWITIQITTLSGTFAITTGTADYIKWCEGGHI